MTVAKWFGASVKRKEDPTLLRGGGRYVDDIHLHGMSEAAFVRSPHPHAMIKSIDVSAARAVPGVRAVITYNDLPEGMRDPLEMLQPNPIIEQDFLPYVLAKSEVSFTGEAIVLVVADNRYIAEDAAALVDIEYDPLPAVADCLKAIEPGAPLAHSDAKSNVPARMRLQAGNTDEAFAQAKNVYSRRLSMHRGGAFSMECRGLVADWNDASGAMTVYAATQAPHRLQRALMSTLGFRDNQVRVIAPDVGGGFGPKGAVYHEYLALCSASYQLARPVKWIEDRRENFVATNQERDQIWDMQIAVDDEAKIMGVRGRLVHDAGAYIPWGVVLPWISAATVPGPYVIPNYNLEIVVALTNKISVTPVRGAGRPQGVLVMERLMDLVATERGLDPAEVRRRNMIQPHQMPYKVGIMFRDGRPVTYDSGNYPECQRKAIEIAGYEGFADRQKEAHKQGRYIGIAISNAVEATGLGPYEGATVRVLNNGKISVYMGASTQGQSHKTTLAQIAADHFGVDIKDIEVTTGDTNTISQGMGTFGARIAVTGGNSVHMAASEVAAKIKAIAAQMLDVPVTDLILRDGRVEVVGLSNEAKAKGNISGLGKTLKEIATESIGQTGFAMPVGTTPGLESTAYFLPEQSAYSNGTHIAEVEVDAETGQVAIRRYVVVHDCGRVINPMVVEGQIVGGVAHAIGNALFEQLVYDENAQPLTTNFGEYMLPLADDVPHIEVHHLETPSPLNPLGVKGAGEGGTIAGIAAIIGAVENALIPIGVRIDEAPISPQRIVELIKNAKIKPASG
ncbi:MAG: xanthine dehydrogenase family protein molybdopterin-binding subunit [Pseudolabrys sp.]|nr:xanthine dehydrogenase family protein molybdopterin-binding subunit [Pseudolabrys sp.]